MYELLYRYLVRYKELAIPGIGSFIIDRQPATVDFPAKKITAPIYSVRFEKESHLPVEPFFSWMADKMGISRREAVFRFNDFALELKKHLEEGNRVVWNGIGELKKLRSGDIGLVPDALSVYSASPVPAEKILRVNHEHMVRVGEEQRTSTEMTALLAREIKKRNYWSFFPLILVLLAIGFIGWYLLDRGASGANNSKLEAVEPPHATYSLIK